MNNWKTNLSEMLGSVSYYIVWYLSRRLHVSVAVCSISALSSSLSSMMRHESKGYHLPYGKKINHLVYMDDLKLFAKNYAEIELLLHSVRVFSSDIGMHFSLEKCAHLSLHWGKIVASGQTVLPYGQSIKSLFHSDTYKYLGVLEYNDIKYSTVITTLKGI